MQITHLIWSANSEAKFSMPNTTRFKWLLSVVRDQDGGLPAAAFGYLQQPAMYSAYGATDPAGTAAGLENLAALQRQAGLHTLVGAAAAAATTSGQHAKIVSVNPATKKKQNISLASFLYLCCLDLIFNSRQAVLVLIQLGT